MRRLPALLAAVFIGFLATSVSISQTPAPAPTVAPHAAPRPDVEQMRQEMALIEALLQRDTLADADLERVRERLRPIADGVASILARESPRLDEINARLDKIGPAPKEKDAPESAEVARTRSEQEALKKDVDEAIRVAKLVQVRVEQAQNAIYDYRRRLFARQILDRAESIASPWLWGDVLRAIPDAVSSFIALFEFRLRQAFRDLDLIKALTAAGLLILTLVGYAPARSVLLGRFDSWSGERSSAPTRGERAAAALRGVLLRLVVPLSIAVVLTIALRILGFGADRMGEFLRFALFSLPVLAGLRGLAIGILQPDRPAWRVAKIEQATAAYLFPALWGMVLVVFVGKLLDAAGQSISAGLPIIIAIKGVSALGAALILLRALRKIDEQQEAQAESLDEFGPAVAASAGNTFAIALKVVGWVAGLAIVAAVFTGFIQLGSFLTDQIIWLLAIGGLIALALIVVEEVLAKGTTAETALTRRIRASTGIAPSSIRQIGILSSGILRLLLYTTGVLLALMPFGINSGDLFGSMRAALFGFQIGGVTISLYNITLSILVFVGLFLIFRAIQRWVENTYLPSTSLDAGLQNSITTIIGYIGFIVATILAMSYLGLSLDKIAIVAGALSVGIGFGLQSIVNNFVSGLILLWERPIKVGDLIVVGADTGRVRRINVRSTEIETADRSSLIVPNSEFISGKVKNMMHANRIARIVIPLSVAHTADPQRIRDELLAAANAHLEVMSNPEAGVVFLDVTANSLDFELRCFTDIDAQVSVRSDLMFDIYRRMRDLAVVVPPAKEPLGVGDIDTLADAIATAERARAGGKPSA